MAGWVDKPEGGVYIEGGYSQVDRDGLRRRLWWPPFGVYGGRAKVCVLPNEANEGGAVKRRNLKQDIVMRIWAT